MYEMPHWLMKLSEKRLPTTFVSQPPHQRMEVMKIIRAYNDTVVNIYDTKFPRWFLTMSEANRWSVVDWVQRHYKNMKPFAEYTRPNGGNRIISSNYCKLRTHWVRSTGDIMSPKDMNQGHLQNSCKLLKESHGNVVARSTDLLGRMAHHYQNQPEIVQRLTDLCLMMQKVEVDQMYPIFNALAREVDREFDSEVMAFNDSLEKW